MPTWDVHQVNVVMVLGPIISNEYRQLASLLDVGETCSSPRAPGRQPNGSVLEARHPISATGDPTNRPGHDLGVGINHHSRACTVLTVRRLG